MQVQTAAQAGNAQAELTAISNVLENFADTEFKAQLLNMAMDAAQRTGDQAQVATWAERAMAADPNDIVARVTVAETTAAHMRENDLDKADNIKKVNDLAHKALDLIQSGGTPPAGVPADKLDDYKKELAGARLERDGDGRRRRQEISRCHYRLQERPASLPQFHCDGKAF